jgi:SH3-like domain-containing protein
MTQAAQFLPNTSINQSSRRRLQKWVILFSGIAFLCAVGAEIVWAANKSGLPLPRFVSLRKDQVNVRTGPGVRYPVDWVFTYKNMPVEILAEFKGWRKVRDWKGTTGWVHRSMLSGKYRWILVRKNTVPLHREAKPDAPVIAKLHNKVVGRLKRCRGAWCEVTVNGIQGWIKRIAIWGVYPHEGKK